MNKNIKTLDKFTKGEQPFLQALINTSPYAVVQLDEKHKIVGVNLLFEQMFGHKEADILGCDLDELLVEENLHSDATEITQLVTSGALVRKVSQREKKDGSIIDVEIFAVPVIVGEEIVGAFGLYHDISDRVKTEKALRESEERYRSVTESASDAIIIIDSEGYISTWNRGAEKMFGYTETEILGKNLKTIIPDTHQDKHSEGIYRVSSGGERHVIGKTVELQGVRKGGQIFPTELSLSEWEVEGKKHYGGILRDISERKKHEDKLRFMSYHDALTGIYNRGYFEEELSRIDGSRQFPVSIIVCDLDNLKQINDTLGHAVGDNAIKGAASILSSSFRREEVVARIGGDEFAIILSNYDVLENNVVLKRLEKAIADYNDSDGEIDGYYRPISLSMGKSLILENESLVEGYKRADKEMYLNKAQKKYK